MRMHLLTHTHKGRRKGMGTCFQTAAVILTRDFFFSKFFATVTSIPLSTARGTERERREREKEERERGGREEGGRREERREKREERREKRERENHGRYSLLFALSNELTIDQT